MSQSFVAIRVFSSLVEAEIARGLMDAAGIPASLSADDCGGMRPALQLAGGVRLLVSPEHAKAALELLDEPLTSNGKET